MIKKMLILVLVVISLGFSANAQKTRYSVTVTTFIKYTYVDENNNKVGETVLVGQAQTIDICAETKYEAVEKAIHECSTMCENSYKDEGYKNYKGNMYKCTSIKYIDNATATSLFQSC